MKLEDMLGEAQNGRRTITGRVFDSVRFSSMTLRSDVYGPSGLVRCDFVNCVGRERVHWMIGDVLLEQVRITDSKIGQSLVIEGSCTVMGLEVSGRDRGSRFRVSAHREPGPSVSEWSLDVSRYLGQIEILGLEPEQVERGEHQFVLNRGTGDSAVWREPIVRSSSFWMVIRAKHRAGRGTATMFRYPEAADRDEQFWEARRRLVEEGVLL